MEYAFLGRTDLRVSRLCFGCWAIGGHGWGKIDDSNSIAAINHAVELGINFFDTADVYGFGHSEEVLRQALGPKRHEVVISTKFGVSWDENGKIGRNCSPSYVVNALEQSLRRLQLDCIPLYLIHWPDSETPIEATLDALQRCQEQGKVRYVGCSNLPLPLLRKVAGTGLITSVQLPYSLIDRRIEAEYLPVCSHDLQLAITVYGVLAKGLLSGNLDCNTMFDRSDNRSRDEQFQEPNYGRNLLLVDRLRKIGRNYGKTPAQTAIRWVLDNVAVSTVLVGIETVEHIDDNIGAFGWRLSSSDWLSLPRSN